MAESLGELYLQLSLKTNDLEAQLNQLKAKTESTTKGMENSFSSLLKPIAEVALSMEAVHKAFEFASESVKKYIEAAQASAKVDAILKSTQGAAGLTRDAIDQISEKLAKLSGTDNATIMNDVIAQLLTFKNISKDSFEQAGTAVANLSAVMGRDLVGTSIMVGKALNDPLTGMTALKRVGVTLSEQQKEQVKDFMKVNDIASAQKVILKELDSEFGGTAEASNKATGGLNELKVAFVELEEFVGGKILAVLKPFIAGFTSLIDVVKGAKDPVRELNEKFESQKTSFDVLANTYLNLKDKVSKSTVETSNYKEAIKQLMEQYPNYFKNVNLEKDSYDKVKTAISDAREELDKYIESKILEATISEDTQKLADNYKNAFEIQKKITEEKIKRDALKSSGEYDKEVKVEGPNGHPLNTGWTKGQAEENIITGLENDLKNVNNTTDTTIAKQKELQEFIKGKFKDVIPPTTPTGTNNSGTHALTDEEKKALEKLNKEKLDLSKNYYDSIKFNDSNYIAWKLQQIDIEKEYNTKTLGNKDIAEKMSIEEKKKLYQEEAAFKNSKKDESLKNAKEEATDQISFITEKYNYDVAMMDKDLALDSTKHERKKKLLQDELEIYELTLGKQSTEYQKVKDEISVLNIKIKATVTEEVKTAVDNYNSSTGRPDREGQYKELNKLDPKVIAEQTGQSEISVQKSINNQKKKIEEDYLNWKVEEWKKSHATENAIIQTSFKTMGAAYDTFFSTILNKDMTGKERLQQMWDSTKQAFVSTLADMLKAWIENQIMQAVVGKAAQGEAIIAAGITGTSIAMAYATAAAMASIASFGTAAVTGTSALVTGVGIANGLAAVPKFERGGEFTVPQNYTNDSFLFRATAHEEVKIKPFGSSGGGNGMSDSQFDKLCNILKAQTLTIASKDMSVNIHSNMDSMKFYQKEIMPNAKRVENSRRKVSYVND